MTQGELEKLPLGIQQAFSDLEMRIMTDIVRRIRENGFATDSTQWQISRLQQLGESEQDIMQWIRETLQLSGEELDTIFSDQTYEEYTEHEREYKASDAEQIPYEDNKALQQTVEAARQQTKDTFQNLTNSLGFAIADPATKRIAYSPLMDFYRSTLDDAMMDIQSGAFSYQEVLKRTVNKMTDSGLRWIDYESGAHNRVDVAVRRAVLTGFRQVQGKINEQVAAELQTDYYEVTWHGGARPEHQRWQGKVYSMSELRSVCGLGSVTGLKGINCYHDYRPFIPGVSTRTYTDDELKEMNARENRKKTYNGKEYTTYEALQQQRKMETVMRKYRQDIKLLQEGGADEEEVILKKARYQGTMQTYKDFSKKMGLPEQKQRILQDGLTGSFMPTKTEQKKLAQKQRDDKIKAEIKAAGMRGEIELSPKHKIDVSDYSFDDEHINVERAHKVSREDAERFIQESDIAFTKWKGRFVNYYGPNGAVFVDVENKNIRTAFQREEYDTRVQKMREVLEANGDS